METGTTNKKTGATPIVEEGIGGGEILGVIELKPVMVKLRDGHGQEVTKLAIVVPGGEVYFINDTAIGKPAQKWVKAGVLKALGLKG